MTQESEIGVLSFGAELSSPPRIPTEPTSVAGNTGVWVCDSKYINAIYLNGQPIQFTQRVTFQYSSITWLDNAGNYNTPNPNFPNGGILPQFKLKNLVYGIGNRGVAGKAAFVIEGASPEIPIVLVNDDSYGDNNGYLTIRISWV